MVKTKHIGKSIQWKILDSDFQNDIAILSANQHVGKMLPPYIMKVVNETVKAGDIISRKGNRYEVSEYKCFSIESGEK